MLVESRTAASHARCKQRPKIGSREQRAIRVVPGIGFDRGDLGAWVGGCTSSRGAC
jgi:hypothetical protein